MERRIAEDLKSRGTAYRYEQVKISYIVPQRDATYTPDFVLPNGIIVEAKGRFKTEDRTKHLLIKKQLPDLDIRFVFSRAAAPIYKGSKTTHEAWCVKHQFQFAEKLIPPAWAKETK